MTSDLGLVVVSETSVALDFLDTLHVLSQLGIQTVGDQLSFDSISEIVLSVQEPSGDVVVYLMVMIKILPTGLAMMSLIFSTSCSVSSPALHCSHYSYLLLRSTWAVLRMIPEKRLPIPLMTLIAN